MLLLLQLIFLFSFLILSLRKFVFSKFVGLLAFVPFSLFLYFLSFIDKIAGGEVVVFQNSWVPSLGISLDFRVDGLSLLFSLLITGVGSLIYLYASSYLKGNSYLHRFYCYLTLFMGAMLGLVLSDNLISVFVFWELTSIVSFFLIGFNNDDEEARKSALWALSITGLGGFFLLCFSVGVNSIAGSYSIQTLLSSGDVLRANAMYPVLLLFLFVAAFTKSAQFPFHFWLPGAMKAPTPVSAYLHSATMVKAGIYLLARFTPILGATDYWNVTLQVVGGTTMIYGAIHSVFRKDMKGILAYSTIAALGVLVFLLGLGTEIAFYAFAVFIVAHALYKATLFLVTGIVDHIYHTRDINELSGIRKHFPILAVTAGIAALSSAGIPLLYGFIGKELFYGATLHHDVVDYSVAFTVLAVLTNIFLTASGFLVGLKPFFGQVKHEENEREKLSWALWLPLVALSLFTLVFGVFPQLANIGYVTQVMSTMYSEFNYQELAIWHGVNTALLLSGVTIVVGCVVYIFFKNKPNTMNAFTRLGKFSPQRVFEVIAEGTREIAFRYTSIFQNGYLRIYLFTIIIFFIGLVGYKLFMDVPLQVNTDSLSEFRVYELVVFLITVIAVIYAMYTPSRLSAIAATGVVGYCICLIFVFYGAPDLAMTQFAIDTLTVVLFVLVMFKLPAFLKLSNRRIQIRDAVVSLAFGILISLITLQALVSPAEKDSSRFYAENAYVLAKGKNVVNVILVDFRGFDTLIETIVLSIAALGVYGLLKYKKEDEEVIE